MAYFVKHIALHIVTGVSDTVIHEIDDNSRELADAKENGADECHDNRLGSLSLTAAAN
jgi:hypothetical protein